MTQLFTERFKHVICCYCGRAIELCPENCIDDALFCPGCERVVPMNYAYDESMIEWEDIYEVYEEVDKL